MKRCFSRVVVCGLLAAMGMLTAAASASTSSMVEYALMLQRLPANIYAAKTLQFAKARLGKQVGNGECWTLAHDGLDSAGAKRPGQEYATYVFGAPVTLANVRPGDILQFEDVKFVAPNGSWQGFGHHTAIVVARSGNTIQLIQQNVMGNRTVQYGSIDLSQQKAGTIHGYRAAAR